MQVSIRNGNLVVAFETGDIVDDRVYDGPPRTVSKGLSPNELLNIVGMLKDKPKRKAPAKKAAPKKETVAKTPAKKPAAKKPAAKGATAKADG